LGREEPDRGGGILLAPRRNASLKKAKSVRERPDYGIDAPHVIRNLAVSGLTCLLIAVAFSPLRWFYSPAISLLATAAVWLYNSKFGKLRLREKLMSTLSWTGNEQVLDVGCGSGLLVIAAAKRLSEGSAVGVDIWRSEDLSNTDREAALRNAMIEGVAERVSVEEGDARQLPFGDATFDVVVSLNVLHNIAKREEREQALTEIVRVLKPEGRFVIADFRNVGEYTAMLREKGITSARKKLVMWLLFYPAFAAIGTKPPG
jgi:ubiquinone/menaquinone biosynthesis C-methylase UbiE